MENKKLNKDKLITFIFIILGILILGTLGVKIYFDFIKSNNSAAKELEKLELYGYTLDNNDTKLYKDNFKELEDALNEKEIDYDKYAELLSKLYIIDFYTLSNKISSTDVGSIEFVHPDIADNFKLEAKDTIYKYIKINFNGKRTQELPEVSSVTIDEINNSKYMYDKTEYDSYNIKCNWTYTKDLGYETEANLILIKDGTKLYIVESD